jgi:hypothetical protein
MTMDNVQITIIMFMIVLPCVNNDKHGDERNFNRPTPSKFESRKCNVVGTSTMVEIMNRHGSLNCIIIS